MLNDDFRKIGGRLPGIIKSRPPTNQVARVASSLLPDISGHKPNFFQQVKREFDATGALPKLDKFGQKYRLRLDGHDELLSTSSVRELMLGVLEEHKRSPLDANSERVLNDVFNDISRVRVPTGYSGFAFASGDVMQHPTSAGNGMFADARQTMRRHNALDLERKVSVADSMLDALKQPNASAESVAHAGLRTAISFTLNEFTAPITASDVQPYALKGNSSAPSLDEQLQSREEIKSMFVLLGGQQESDGGQSAAIRRARPFEPRRGQQLRSVSPPRF